DRVGVVVAGWQSVDQRGGMFDLTVEADDRRLPVSLDHIAGSDGVDDHPCQQLTELRGDVVDLRLQILDEATAGPWIAHDGYSRDLAQRDSGSTSALDEGRLVVQDGLAQLDRHGAPCVPSV